jgi:serine protease inhibitor ecotin
MKLTFITKQLPVLLCITLFSFACGSKKTGTASNDSPVQTSDTYQLDGYQAHTLTPPKKESGDQPMKIEIVPGKTMEVDCNRHSLMGEFTQKELSDANLY